MKRIQHEELPMRTGFPQYRRPRPVAHGRIVTYVILISLLIVLIVGGVGIGFRMLNPTPVRTTTETRTFHLNAGTPPTLIVANNHGFVHVHPGTCNTLTVVATKVGDGFGASPDDFKVSYSQNGNTITILIRSDALHPFDFSRASQADLEVAVPVKSDLRLETNSGDISVTGVQGKMTLTSDSGSLQVTDVSLLGITLLSTNSGSITMHGSIDTLGHSTFQTNSGAVDVILPRTASFHATLTSNSGTITNDFPIVPPHGSDPNGRTVSGDIGNLPQSSVVIQSNSGSLHLGHT